MIWIEEKQAENVIQFNTVNTYTLNANLLITRTHLWVPSNAFFMSTKETRITRTGARNHVTNILITRTSFLEFGIKIDPQSRNLTLIIQIRPELTLLWTQNMLVDNARAAVASQWGACAVYRYCCSHARQPGLQATHTRTAGGRAGRDPCLTIE